MHGFDPRKEDLPHLNIFVPARSRNTNINAPCYLADDEYGAWRRRWGADGVILEPECHESERDQILYLSPDTPLAPRVLLRLRTSTNFFANGQPASLRLATLSVVRTYGNDVEHHE